MPPGRDTKLPGQGGHAANRSLGSRQQRGVGPGRLGVIYTYTLKIHNITLSAVVRLLAAQTWRQSSQEAEHYLLLVGALKYN